MIRYICAPGNPETDLNLMSLQKLLTIDPCIAKTLVCSHGEEDACIYGMTALNT
jgi:hypothetical protein